MTWDLTLSSDPYTDPLGNTIDGNGGVFDTWLERFYEFGIPTDFDPINAPDNRSSIATNACSHGMTVVGSYNEDDGTLSPFSSRGPAILPDPIVIDVTAPGSGTIWMPRSDGINPITHSDQVAGGTSIAAPHGVLMRIETGELRMFPISSRLSE